MRETAGEAAGGRRCVPGPDNGNCAAIEQIEVAPRDQQRRRVVELGKQPRIEPLPERDIAGAELFAPRDFPFSVVPAEQPRRRASASPGELRHRFQRRLRAAEAPDELAVGDWPDAGRPNEPKTLD